MNRLLLSLLFFLSIFAHSAFAQEVPEVNWAELQKTKPWEATEQWEPVPPKVTVGQWSQPPSDAIILFDGTNLDHWHRPKYAYGVNMETVEAIIKAKTENPSHSPATWNIKDGALVVNPNNGAIETKKAFGNLQLHIEWLAPVDEGKEGQGYSNSGVFFMGLYEVQILNSYENTTYPNGQAGSLYKQHIPMVNASRPPGEWQAYDIIFNAPIFKTDGSLEKPAYVTVLHNGVLIQNHVELKGPCIYIGQPEYTAHPTKMPLLLQDHRDQVRFRNIWVREF
ncbi:MAG: DUF1080 domain-containing protein [Bacteroidota bacterium]